MSPIVLGSIFFVGGLILIFQSIRLFFRGGNGTLAPWDPTKKLITNGVYRYTRNPMIAGVLLVLLGQAIFLGSPPIFVWFVISFIANAIYIPLSEEPGLEDRFGDQYHEYRTGVPRWIPRHMPGEVSIGGDDERRT